AAITQETSQVALALQRTDAITIKQLRSEIQSCASLLSRGTPVALDGWRELFEAVNERATVIDDIVAALALEHRGDEFTELRWCNWQPCARKSKPLCRKHRPIAGYWKVALPRWTS